MKQTDFAYSRRKTIAVTVTRKQTVLAALDAFISGMLLILFLTLTLGTMWLIFGK